MQKCKKLIEVAMPIKEISAESVRDKSIRHGHISTLHLWWARRPLPVCRAVVFASLIPDPLDENCPQAFKDAVEILLGKANNTGDPYKPYENIPYTAAIDKMEDNLRNRLLMFIGKFSEIYSQNERNGKSTSAKDHLSDYSLIKWDNKNNEELINKARKLIWVSHNSKLGLDADTLIHQFELHYKEIKDAENDLYSTLNRHIQSNDITAKEVRLNNAINGFLAKMPKVFDPFAGGGAIPLEAARLGCKSYGNDINPVAYIIQKGSIEFPQKFGKPISYSKQKFISYYGQAVFNKIDNREKVIEKGEVVGVKIKNRLSYDVEFYAKKLISETEKEIGYLYPANEKGEKPIAYYWARVGICSNPLCKAEVPLLRTFYLVNTPKKQVHLKPIILGKQIEFEIKAGKYDENEIKGWNNRTNITCPICGSLTDSKTLKEQFIKGAIREKLLAVIWHTERGKDYKLPTKDDIRILEKVIQLDRATFSSKMPKGKYAGFGTLVWGFDDYNQLFSARQFMAIQSLARNLDKIKNELKSTESEYAKAVITYLGILIDRGIAISTSFGRWDITRENVQSLFSKQAISIIFDYPEGILFGNTTGSLNNQLDWIKRYIESESEIAFYSELKNASSGDKYQFPAKYLDAVVTDPPYYDSIAYADLSDFFYVWLKRTLSDLYPLNFATPQTPKSEECTALKHHHNNKLQFAKSHFENKLVQIFTAIEYQTIEIVSIMFAHQSTEAWTTLCNSILGANMNITGSWAVDTEMANRSLGLKGAVLASSVTVACKPSIKEGYGDYKDVKKSIDLTVSKEVDDLYTLGFRGADLLTACFGQAVSVFGKYEKVEKADGSEVTVAELLEMAKESAFNSLLKGFDGDDFTKFYIGWLQLFGFTESNFDDAAKFSRVGLTINVADLFTHNLFIKNGNKQELAGYGHRLTANHRIGEGNQVFIIDNVHKAMALYDGKNRNALLEYIVKVASSANNSFWRVITSLCEVLPQGSEDFKQATGLLLNKESLIRESKNIQKSKGTQGELF